MSMSRMICKRMIIVTVKKSDVIIVIVVVRHHGCGRRGSTDTSFFSHNGFEGMVKEWHISIIMSMIGRRMI